MNARPFFAPLAGLLLAAAPAHAEPPHILVSIAPIHSLVASVMQGVGDPELLIPANVSEHDYALKPSDVRRIAGADLIIWIGESLETYLVKPLETEAVANLELVEAPGVDAHPYGEAAGHEEAGADAHEHEEASEAAEAHADAKAHGHDHLGLDPHIWLDPVRAQAIVNAVAEALAGIDAGNAAAYRKNAAASVAELQALDREIGARLAPVAARPFITFHDGYSYFVGRYGLRQVGELTVHPEQRPGAATVRELRETIAAEGVACAFAEPQFDPGLVQSLAGDTAMAVGVLDALGSGLEPGALLYGELLRRNAEAVEKCLLATG